MSTVVVADAGFPRWEGGGANARDGGKNLLFGKSFAKKLHENERNRTERGRASLVPPPWIC